MLAEKPVEEYFMTTTAPPHVTDSTERAALQQQPPTRLNEQAADLLTKPADQTQQNLRPTDKNFQDPVKLADQAQINYNADQTLSIQDRAQMETSIKIADIQAVTDAHPDLYSVSVKALINRDTECRDGETAAQNRPGVCANGNEGNSARAITDC